LSRKYWINVELKGTVSDEMIKYLVEKSYKLVAAGLPKITK